MNDKYPTRTNSKNTGNEAMAITGPNPGIKNSEKNTPVTKKRIKSPCSSLARATDKIPKKIINEMKRSEKFFILNLK